MNSPCEQAFTTDSHGRCNGMTNQEQVQSGDDENESKRHCIQIARSRSIAGIHDDNVSDNTRNKSQASQALLTSGLMRYPNSQEVLSTDIEEQSEGFRSEEKSSTKHRLRSRGSVFYPLRFWWQECFACFLLLVSLIGLIVTLQTQQGRPLRHWSPGLSINTFVAIYTIILRGAAAFILSEGNNLSLCCGKKRIANQ